MSAGPADLKAVHDLVLASKPDLPHDRCALCDTEENLMDTLTKEQHDAAVQAAVEAANAAAEQRIEAAVAEAVSPLQAELDTLRQADGARELDTAVAAATAELTDSMATIQSDLETAQAQIAALTTERDELTAAKTEFEEAVAAASRKDERVAAVQELKVFPESFITAQADSWATLDDDGWAAKLEELGQLKDVVATDDGSKPPATRTAITATSTGGGGDKATASTRLIRAQAGLLTTTGN